MLREIYIKISLCIFKCTSELLCTMYAVIHIRVSNVA
jgi:hypothetical protein